MKAAPVGAVDLALARPIFAGDLEHLKSARGPERVTISEDSLEKLRSLGYIR